MSTLAKATFFLIVITSTLFSQTSTLRVQHPQRLTSFQGTIEEVKLVVTPAGIYTQNDLYLTFSARGTNFYSNDSVEVQLDFFLPREAVVNDLWLWIDETTISKAYILDKWTASSIYESIVNRRRDPALLTKESYYSLTYDYYKLRVYPMAGNGTRKVKMSYLVPAAWTNSMVNSMIPASLFRASLNKPTPIKVFYKQTSQWGLPRIVENQSLNFSVVNDPEFGYAYRCDIPSNMYTSSGQTLTLGIGSPMKNGIYVSRFKEGDDGFYHMAVIPGQVLHTGITKKVVFLFDYDSTKTTYQKQDILYAIRTHLETYYTEADSFNLVFTQTSINVIGNKWYSAGLQGISQAFQAAGASPIINKTDMAELLRKGVDFIKNNGGVGDLCIVGASDRLGDYYLANPIINELRGMLTPDIRVNVVDLLNRNYNSYYFGGYIYRGNDYFYDNLTKITGGYWASARSYTMTALLDGFSKFTSGSVEAFDLHTRLTEGVCYARYTSGVAFAQQLASETPVLQIGKTKGTGAFSVDLVGVQNGILYESNLVIPESEIAEGDTLLSKGWAEKFISSLEGEYSYGQYYYTTPVNTEISQIVEASVKNRVLSRYTAFLALEPKDSVLIPKDPNQNPGNPGTPPTTTDVDEETGVETATEAPVVQAYPNPFNAQTSIRLRLPKGITSDQATLKIYNLLGQLVRTISSDGLSDSRTTTIVWDGRNDDGATVPSGMYFFVLSTPKGHHTLKLVILK